ncbi:TonB-dependent heme/hemoglobin receptor family protein [Alcanivorax xiamenensis]|uniref:TonB-dependent heme/hemoglobin receptor family protein n=1 Tax=Alcanivorax xiamenensis TaxID=1177156 RepID=A0ABQ6YB35_9GAMM|nr:MULTISPECIES: TonB-dependent receptor [Alcanivorax]KAF0807146.1 TonB-dependent heme/hemoglobin receptor family protein [Alcanivorax xiamenensis]
MPFVWSAASRISQCRFFVLVVLLCWGPGGQAQDTSSATLLFEIPELPLDSAILIFSEQASAEVILDGAVAALRGNALYGRYTLERGLQRLLAGTGTRFEIRDNAGHPLIRLIPPPSSPSDVLSLEPIRVQGGASPVDKAFRTPGSASHIDQQHIERFRGTSVGDIFQGVPGVLVGENRNSGGLDINIRGMQGQGRVPVLVDGARQETTVYRGYSGVASRSYIDPDLIGGIDIIKGPSLSAQGTGAVGGLVSMRTLNAEDIVRDGRDFGMRVRGSAIGNNSGSAVSPGTPAGLFTGDFGGADPVYRTDCVNESLCSGDQAMPSDWGYPDGMDRPDWYEAKSWAGSLALAKRLESVDLVAAYAERRQGNYYAGEHGPSAWVDLSDRRKTPFYTEVSPVIRGASRFQAGERIPGTNFESKSGLLKAKMFLPEDQELELSYLRYESVYSEIMPSQIIRFANFSPVSQPRDSDVTVDTYTSRYRWNPAAWPLLDFKAGLWHTRARSTNNSPSATEANLYNNERETYKRWGMELENTSDFLHGAWGESQLRYGLSGQWEDVGTTALTEDTRGLAGRNGKRDEYSAFAAWQYKPVSSVVLDAGLRYTRFKSRDDKPITVYDPRSPNCVDGDGDGECDPLPNRNRRSGTAPIVTLSWEPGNAGLQFYARYAEALRMPSLFESSSGFSFETAPDVVLKPEHTRNREVGINYLKDGLFLERDKLRLKLSYFRNHTRDYLTRTLPNLWEEGGDTTIVSQFTMRNIDSARFHGVELSGGYDMGVFFTEFGVTRYNHIEICHTGSYRLHRCNDYGIAASYINNMVPPRWHGSLTLGMRLPRPALVLGVRGTFMGERNEAPEYNDDTARSFLEVVPWHSYRVYDFFASYQATDRIRLDFNLDNFTDRYYLDALGLGLIPAPGRTARLSLTWQY